MRAWVLLTVCVAASQVPATTLTSHSVQGVCVFAVEPQGTWDALVELTMWAHRCCSNDGHMLVHVRMHLHTPVVRILNKARGTCAQVARISLGCAGVQWPHHLFFFTILSPESRLVHVVDAGVYSR